MDVTELNERLEDFILKFDDNIVDVHKKIFIPDHYMPTGAPGPGSIIPGEETETILQELNNEGFKEWKELFNEYKKLKDNSIRNDFTNKFHSFTRQKQIYLFNPLILNRVKEFIEWREYL